MHLAAGSGQQLDELSMAADCAYECLQLMDLRLQINIPIHHAQDVECAQQIINLCPSVWLAYGHLLGGAV
jgi:hypothetical protein